MADGAGQGVARAAQAEAAADPAEAAGPGPAETAGAGPIEVELEDVAVRLGRVPVLSGVTLRVPAGASLGIIGPAASGKSVLLKLICGLIRPDAGAIRVGGVDIAGMSEAELMTVRRRIGMLFQSYALFDFMTAGENVAFPLVRRGDDPQQIAERVAERLRAVGLDGSERVQPSALSGGMKRRLGIARATVHRPGLVLYDEPTAGLDPVTTSKMYDLIRVDQAETGCTVIAVSSDVAALSRFADRIAMVYGGAIHYEGPAAGIADADDPIVRQFVRGELDGPL